MRFESEAAFHYMLYHDILQWQKDNRDKKDEAPRWYHLKRRLGPLLFSHEGLLLARVMYGMSMIRGRQTTAFLRRTRNHFAVCLTMK